MRSPLATRDDDDGLAARSYTARSSRASSSRSSSPNARVATREAGRRRRRGGRKFSTARTRDADAHRRVANAWDADEDVAVVVVVVVVVVIAHRMSRACVRSLEPR